MRNKRFIFEISVKAVPHTKETAEEIYGKGAWDDKFPIHSHATDLVFAVFQGAYTGCLMAEMRHLGECVCEYKDMTPQQRRYHQYLMKKTRIAKQVMESMKFSKMVSR